MSINYEGVQTFRSTGADDFPVKVIYYRREMLMVPDWDVNHDHGDEDDGESKLINAYLKERKL